MTASSAPTQLIIIRHGESQAQVAGRFSGHSTCTGLSALGRAQAERLRDRLMKTGELGAVDVVYTSILARSIETAAIVGPALGAVAHQPECDWCEIHAGAAEGHTYKEYFERYPVGDDPDDPFRSRFPDGETWAQFYVRVGARLRRVATEHPGRTVVVVGHGGTVGASFVALGNVPPRGATAFTHEAVNTSITQWRWSGADWRLARFNDAAHLSGIEPVDA